MTKFVYLLSSQWCYYYSTVYSLYLATPVTFDTTYDLFIYILDSQYITVWITVGAPESSTYQVTCHKFQHSWFAHFSRWSNRWLVILINRISVTMLYGYFINKWIDSDSLIQHNSTCFISTCVELWLTFEMESGASSNM